MPGRNGSVSDRKSTRLNSSHQIISYAVFCLKKKKRSERLRHRYISSTAASTQYPSSRSTSCLDFFLMLLLIVGLYNFYCFFFFNDTATTEIYTLSLHDALPI